MEALIKALGSLRDRAGDLAPSNPCLHTRRLPASLGLDLARLDEVRAGASAEAVRALTSGSHRKVPLAEVADDDPATRSLLSSLGVLHRSLERMEQVRGDYDLMLGFPFLVGSTGRGPVVRAPLFLFPVRLHATWIHGEWKGWHVTGQEDGDSVRTNRSLLLALTRYARVRADGAELDRLAWRVFYEGDYHDAPEDPWARVEQLAAALPKLGLSLRPSRGPGGVPRGPRVAELPEPDEPAFGAGLYELRPHAVMARLPDGGGSVTSDYVGLARAVKSDPAQARGFWRGFALGSGAQAADPGPIGDVWPVLPWDGTQGRALDLVVGGTSAVVRGAPGTGKTRTVANLAATAVAQGRTLLVVSRTRSSLLEIRRLLDEAGVPDCTALVHDPLLDRKELFRVVRKALLDPGDGGAAVLDLPPPSEARTAALQTLRKDEAWFDRVHEGLVGDRGSRSAFVSYLRRLDHPRQVPDALADSLPDVSPEELPELMKPLPAYCTARLETLVPSQSLPDRPSFAAREDAELAAFREVGLERIKDAVGAHVRWKGGDLGHGLTLSGADAAREKLQEFAAFLADGPPLGHEAWRFVGKAWTFVDGPGAAAGVDPVGEDGARLMGFVAKRDKAKGRFLRAPRGKWRELNGLLETWDELAELPHRLVLPSYHGTKKALVEYLKKEKLDASDMDKGVERLKRRLGLSRALQNTHAGLQMIELDREALKLAPADALRGTLDAARAALDFASRWKGKPTEMSGTLPVEFPTTHDQLAALRHRVAHALEAPPLFAAWKQAEEELVAWVGSAGKAWMKGAFDQGRPELVQAWFDHEVTPNFERLRDAERLVAEVDARAPELAEIALRLVREGERNLPAMLAAAYAERWVRDAERAAPELGGFEEGADRRARRRQLEASDALLQDALQAVPERARLRRRSAIVGLAPLGEAINAIGRLPSVHEVVQTYWESGLSEVLPIWLCSPEAVSEALPLQKDLFDYVVLEDAGVLPFERAVPSVYRGRTTLVIGDPAGPAALDLFDAHQRPDAAGPPRSALDQAADAAPTLELDWAWRAHYPELVEHARPLHPGRLRTALFVSAPRQGRPLERVRIRGAWTSGGNRTEAVAAVDLLDQMLEMHPGHTVGVAALGSVQADCIHRELAARRRRSRTFAGRWAEAEKRHASAPPVIWDARSWPGASRDIVLLSAGGVPGTPGLAELDTPDAERLVALASAVAVDKLVVLHSFDPAELDAASPGPAALRALLAWAGEVGAGGRVKAERAQDRLPAQERFVESITAALKEKGYRCVPDIGRRDCAVDLVVRDSVPPHRPLLGLLLDGPHADSFGGARSREHARWAFLQQYGWALTSVAAKSWLRHRAEVMDRLLKGVDRAAAAKKRSTPPPPDLGPAPTGAVEG